MLFCKYFMLIKSSEFITTQTFLGFILHQNMELYMYFEIPTPIGK